MLFLLFCDSYDPVQYIENRAWLNWLLPSGFLWYNSSLEYNVLLTLGLHTKIEFHEFSLTTNFLRKNRPNHANWPGVDNLCYQTTANWPFELMGGTKIACLEKTICVTRPWPVGLLSYRECFPFLNDTRKFVYWRMGPVADDYIPVSGNSWRMRS